MEAPGECCKKCQQTQCVIERPNNQLIILKVCTGSTQGSAQGPGVQTSQGLLASEGKTGRTLHSLAESWVQLGMSVLKLPRQTTTTE
jgi:hypothetical protein